MYEIKEISPEMKTNPQNNYKNNLNYKTLL